MPGAKPSPSTSPEPCDNTSIAVSVKSTLKSKSTATKPLKCSPNGTTKNHGELNKLLVKLKNLFHKKPAKDCCAWPSSEVLLCNILACIGALVIAGVVFRSLYLMYCKPEEV